jgi:hypothetical protein
MALYACHAKRRYMFRARREAREQAASLEEQEASLEEPVEQPIAEARPALLTY